MNTRQTRLFAIGGTLFAGLLFLGMTIDSHRQFPALTHSDKITPEVTLGNEVWHKNNCINCHTLFGEGAADWCASMRSRCTRCMVKIAPAIDATSRGAKGTPQVPALPLSIT